MKHPENGRKITLDNPAPGHYPDVFRQFTGTNAWGSGRGGRHYATHMSCSCGWTPGHKRMSSGRLVPDTKVTNEAPSAGGRSYANWSYQAHIDQVANDPRALPLEIQWLPNSKNGPVHAWAKGPGETDMSLCGRTSYTHEGPGGDRCHYCTNLVGEDHG